MRQALGEAARLRALARWDRAAAIASAEVELRAMAAAGRGAPAAAPPQAAPFEEEALPVPRFARRG